MGFFGEGIGDRCPITHQLLLQSAVGRTHVLRSSLVMDYTTSYFPLIVLGYPLDSKGSYGPQPDTWCPGACVFPPQGSRGQFGPIQFLPMGLHGLYFGFCFAGLLPLRSLINGQLFRVHFRESLVIRLYSEIDHLHLSIEAQCVSHLLPFGDCHIYDCTKF